MSQATEIDVAGATAALEERLAPTRETIEVARGEGGKFTSKPVEDAPTPAAGEAEGEAVAASSESTAAEASTEEEVSFTHIPDEALSPEMLAVKKALQADYTRKTQEVAEYRKLADEFGLESAAEVRQRLELQAQLSDPNNWPQLHAELTEHLQGEGLSRPVAQQAASVALGQAVDQLSDDTVFGGDDDYEGEDLPPAIAARLAALERQNQQVLETIRQRDIQAEQEARFAQIARHLTTQETAIRAKNAEAWGDSADEYMEACYDLMGDTGDLNVGLQRLETLLGYGASRYLVTKEEARRAPAPPPGEGVISSQEEEAPSTLEDGHRRAMEYEARRQAAEAGL